MRFDHLGIATDDLDGLAATFEAAFDVPLVHEETYADELRIAFLDLGNGYFELLEPIGGDGDIARFLEGQGGGIHHVALETADIEAALDAARAAGVGLIDESPRPGAWGHRIAFLDPATTGGVLVEFTEH